MRKFIIAALLVGAIPAGASAAQIILSGSNVVGASSVYFQGAGNSGAPFEANGSRVTGTFGAGNLFNSQLTDPATEEFFSGDYFLTGDGQSQDTVPNPYVTVDLGGTFNLANFTLSNTSNGSSNDRGTGGFTILGANSLVADGPNGFTLGGDITTLVSGTLAQQVAGSPPAGQTFSAASNTAVRYIQFVPTSATAANLYNPQSYGLNELKVFSADPTGAVPEPATWAMMIMGFGMVGSGLRVGRRKQTTRIACA